MARHVIGSALELKSLVAAALAQASVTGTRQRVSDGDGLRIEVTPAGNTSWQLRYDMLARRNQAYTLGKYPDLGLKAAREIAGTLRDKIARGIDPNEEKKAARRGIMAAAEAVEGDTVDQVFADYLKECERQQYAVRTLTTMRRSYDFDVADKIGAQVAKTVKPEQIELILRGVEARNSHESRKRLAAWLRHAFKFGKISPNPVLGVDQDTFKKPVKSKEGHPGVVEPHLLAQVLRTIDAFKGSPLSRAALLLYARMFVRPDELRLADWTQVRGDFFHAQVILKKGTVLDHLVPLPHQTKALLESIRPIHPTFILPGVRRGQRMSDATLGHILHGLGWKDVHTAHGFRKSASTLLNEMGWHERWVDFQLSHKLLNKGESEADYNKAKYLQQRIPIVECWNDYIDALLDPTSGADQMLPMYWREAWLEQYKKKHPKVQRQLSEAAAEAGDLLVI